MKLWQKSLISLGIVGAGFGGIIGALYAYSKTPEGKGTIHFTEKSLENDVKDFKDLKYESFFRDPITNEEIGNYNPSPSTANGRGTVNGKEFQKWFDEYKTKNKKFPVQIIQSGPIEFRNFYLEAIFPQTFIKFVKWFSEEIPWGPEISSLSYFKISKGIKKSSGKTVLGSYSAVKNRTKRIEFSPDSFYDETNINTFLIKMLHSDIAKDQIPTLIKSINDTNEIMFKKYPNGKWKDHVVRLYSLQKIENDKYRPIVSKVADLVYKIDKNSPLELEKVSDIDVIWDEKTMTVKTENKDSYKLNIEKSISNIKIWKSLYGKKWKGLSYEWLKHVTHHEYGHLFTSNSIFSGANKYVGTKVAGVSSNLLQPIDFDELNRYLEAMVPQIRALQVSVNLYNTNGKYDWNFYEDRLNDYNSKIIKVKPDPGDFNQIAFEYRAKDATLLTRESLEKIFGSDIDPTDPQKAPYKVDIDQFLAKLQAGERPRFFNYSFRDAKAFAKAVKIPVYALYIMNAFDALPATKNPALTSRDSIRINGKYFIYDESDKVGRVKYLSNTGEFKRLEDLLLEIDDYHGNKVLIDVTGTKPSDRTRPLEDYEIRFGYNVSEGGKITSKYKIFAINNNARDKEGKSLRDNSSQVKSLIDKIISSSNHHAIAGAEQISNLISKVGTFNDYKEFDITDSLWGTSRSPKGLTKKPLLHWKASGAHTGYNYIYLKLSSTTSATKTKVDNIISYYNSKIPDSDLNEIEFEIIELEVYNAATNKVEKITSKNGSNFFLINLFKSHLLLKKAPRFIIYLASSIHSKYSGTSYINKIVIKIKKSGYVRPPVNHNEALISAKKVVLKKWLDSVSNGSATTINESFSHYKFSLAEVLTRDWVQITQKITKAADFNYNSDLFPISSVFGFEAFINPGKLVDFIYNKQTKKSYRDIIEPFAEYEIDKTNLHYVQEFIRTMYDNLLKSLNRNENNLAKAFPQRTIKINMSSDTELYQESLSFLNISDRYLIPNKTSYEFKIQSIKDHYFEYLETLKTTSWHKIKVINNGYFIDRWLRSSLASNQADEGTSNSWVLYDDKGIPVKYDGNLKKIDGTQVTTRPEAYWTFVLKSHGVGIRNISSMWLSPERDAIAMWGYIPKSYESKVKYIQFRDVNNANVIKIPIKFNVDNLFYYSERPGVGKKTTLADEGFVSWNIDYTVMGTWVDAKLKNGDYEIHFVNSDGKIVNIMWNNKRITMTGNGKSTSTKGTKKMTDHIVTSNWQDEIYAAIVIKQNNQGKDMVYIKNQFPI